MKPEPRRGLPPSASILASWLVAATLLGAGGAVAAPARTLGGFESDADTASWQASGATLRRTRKHRAAGAWAAEVRFAAGGAPALALPVPRRTADWRGFATLRFFVHNPGPEQQRLTLELTDADGAQYKEQVFLFPRADRSIETRLGDAAEHIDLARVARFRIFLWHPPHEVVLFVDEVDLLPGVTGQPAASRRGVALAPGPDWDVAWASSLEKLSPDPAGLVARRGAVEVELARDESESFQLVLIGGNGADAEVRVGAEPAGDAPGVKAFPASSISIRRVGFVTTRKPPYPTTRVGEWPDPLPLASEFNLTRGRVQPVWVTLHAPRDIPAGRYRTRLRVAGPGGRDRTVEVNVRVWDFALPPAPALRTAFELSRGRLRRTYRELVSGGAAWSERIDELEALYQADMLAHRVSPMVHLGTDVADPGSRLQPLLDRGLGAFAAGRQGGNFDNHWPADPATMAVTMGGYRALAGRLREAGLLERAYVYAYDEPVPGDPRVAMITAALHHADPELRTLVALNRAPDLATTAGWLGDSDILALRQVLLEPSLIDPLRGMGKELWMYVSSPAAPYPNLVIDAPAIGHRILPWVCFKLGLEGLLYWSVNHWRVDPWKETASFAGQNGNGVLYYPGPDGPVPSLRLEVLRDGLEDYDYLDLLRHALAAARAAAVAAPALLAEAEQRLAIDPAVVASARHQTRDPEVLLAARRGIASCIERLHAATRAREQQGPTAAPR